MNLLEIVQTNVANFDRIDINPIFNLDKETVGYHSVSYLKDGFPFSGGTHANQQTALRICIAEALERALFYKIIKNNNNDFLTKEFPSTCGFACGFESDKTKYRAICESLERWAWSKWIDDGHQLNIKTEVHLDRLSEALAQNFIKRNYLYKNLEIQNMKVQFCVFLGETESGVFAGSRVCNLNEDPWQHAVIEAFRNYRNYEVTKKNNSDLKKEDIVRQRAVYFGDHKASAFDQIERANNSLWPSPSVLFLKEFNTNIPQVYLWRCLLNNWINWDFGDETRFVY